MKFTQVYSFADKNAKNCDDGKKMSEAELREVCKKQHQQSAINNRRNQITGSASNALKKAQDMLSRAPQIQQFVVGGAAGLATGFVTNKVGKTAAIIAGGSILLVVGANQAGIVNINWDKFGKHVEQTGSKLEMKVPALKGNIGKYARANTFFVAGFIGGFLIGMGS